MKEEYELDGTFRKRSITVQGEKGSFIYPIAIFHKSLNLYNPNLNIEFVVLFENIRNKVCHFWNIDLVVNFLVK